MLSARPAIQCILTQLEKSTHPRPSLHIDYCPIERSPVAMIRRHGHLPCSAHMLPARLLNVESPLRAWNKNKIVDMRKTMSHLVQVSMHIEALIVDLVARIGYKAPSMTLTMQQSRCQE